MGKLGVMVNICRTKKFLRTITFVTLFCCSFSDFVDRCQAGWLFHQMITTVVFFPVEYLRTNLLKLVLTEVRENFSRKLPVADIVFIEAK